MGVAMAYLFFQQSLISAIMAAFNPFATQAYRNELWRQTREYQQVWEFQMRALMELTTLG